MQIHPKSPLLRLIGAALGVGITFISTQVAAQSAPDVSILAGSCANCHGTDGRSPGVMASIAGRPEAALRTQLKAFKSDSPPAGTTIMNRIARGYTDAQLDALAKHFSQVKAQALAESKEQKQ